ncbi:LysM repeat protein [Bacillus mesophilus]|uniref:LysM peptidoglycan-binding domain-containing protein n=1 Tax=Bacillus mesophilus TaxID=1808955 RepID=A0A6M0Q4C4_9BACI|nr:LysM domain-containing protein [Bacillus mesophilus]MBM7660355.1 LysM repeat protein [Bacillus mesophilus]NEY71064.1 LysM peptidoglycan-binding domain-containing protein [Bacillus mesophilus]
MKKATKLLVPALGFGLVFGAVNVSASKTVTVEPGDTYWGIAQGYKDVLVEDMIEANEYEPFTIPVEAEITIPTEDQVTHVIQPGNTLSEIAAVYDGVSVDDLFELNPEIDPNSLTIGSEIVVVDYSNENQKMEDTVPELDVIEVMNEATETIDSIFESASAQHKIPNIESKQELVDYVRSFMSLGFSKWFAENYFEETDEGLYVIPKDGITWLDTESPYKVEEQNEREVKVIQERNTERLGHRNMIYTLRYDGENWIVDTIESEVL